MVKNTTDNAVMALLAKVTKKKEAIKNASKRPQWKTSCTIGKDPTTTQNRINIQTVRDENILISLWAWLMAEHAGMCKAADDLGLTWDTTYMGYTIQDWLDDIRTMVRILKVERQKEELAELDKRVNELVSPDQRREMELKQLQELLK